MTAQVPDFVLLQGVEFALAGVNDEGLFVAEAHGITPSMISTACWRGYICWYAVPNQGLILDRLVPGAASTPDDQDIEAGHQLLGRSAHRNEAGPFQGCLDLQDLALPVLFSGGLLLSTGFVASTYVHMGFHPAWRYESVAEFCSRKAE